MCVYVTLFQWERIANLRYDKTTTGSVSGKICIWALTSHQSQKSIPDGLRPNELNNRNPNRSGSKKPYALNKGSRDSTMTGNAETVIKVKHTFDYINFCICVKRYHKEN